MEILYNTHSNTCEYLKGRDSEARQNPMWDPETHNPYERWLFNPKTSSLERPPEAGEHEVVVLENCVWVVKPDFRGKVYFDTASQERHIISEIGTIPESCWTDREPLPYSRWNGTDWEIDLGLWMDSVVRPQRDAKLLECDFTMMPDYPVDQNKREEWKTYRMQLRDLPEMLTSVTDSIPWPPMPR